MGNPQIKRYIYWDSSYSIQDYVNLTDGMQAHFDAVSGYTILSTKPSYLTFLYRNVRDVHDRASDVTPSGMKELDYFRSQKWLLTDANGTEVVDPNYPGNHYCDIGNPAYQLYIADWYSYYIGLHKYPACFLDNGMCSNASSWHYNSNVAPINPRTGKAWTDQEVVNAYLGLYATLRAKLGSKILIVANSVGMSTGYKYFNFPNYRAGSIPMAQQIDGFMAEQYASYPAMPYYPEKTTPNYTWLDSLNMLVDFESQFQGKNIILPALASDDSTAQLPTDAQKLQYCQFQYCSVLLGMGPKNKYWLSLGLWGDRNAQSLFNTDIGIPLDVYHQDTNGIYYRQFSGGTVYVNPSSVIRGTMPAHTGLIVPSSTPVPPAQTGNLSIIVILALAALALA